MPPFMPYTQEFHHHLTKRPRVNTTGSKQIHPLPVTDSQQLLIFSTAHPLISARMQLPNTILALLTLAATATSALDLGTWYLHCGDSCSDGTLIASGNYTFADFSDCFALSQAYDYCYLTCSGVCEDNVSAWFGAVTYATATCSTTGDSEIGQMTPGDCLAGPWKSYFMKLNL